MKKERRSWRASGNLSNARLFSFRMKMVWCHPEAGSMAEGSRFSFCRIQTRDPSPPGMLPPLRSGCSASVSASAREDKEVCHPEGSSTPEGPRSCFVFAQLRDPSPPGMLPPLRSGCPASVSAFAREDKEVCHPEGSSTPEGSRSCFVFSQLRDPSPPGMLPPLRSGCPASVSAFAREDKEVCHPEGSSTPEGSRFSFCGFKTRDPTFVQNDSLDGKKRLFFRTIGFPA